jgi:tetratricopeptide (TPR) repeat protein
LPFFRRGDFPAVPQYQLGLGGSCCNLGNLVLGGGRPSESLEWYEKAIRTLTAVYEQDRRSVVAKQFLRNSHLGRAQAYEGLKKYAAAAQDLDRVIELSPKAEQFWLGVRRAATRVQAVRAAKTVAEVAELAKLPGWSAGQWYDFACVYALASGKSADKKQEYADRALELLHKAVKAGFTDAARLRQNTDFDPLRMRADFQQLIKQLEAKNP